MLTRVDPARISALLHPFLDRRTLPAVQLRQISTYIDLLLRWNARINLTAVRDPDEIVTRHFGESLFLARHLFPDKTSVARAFSPAWSSIPPSSSKSATPSTHPLPLDAAYRDDGSTGKAAGFTPGEVRVLDIGSGAGFPGLPLKIWAPEIALTLVESNHKKAAFLREVARTLTLTNVNVIIDRAQALVARLGPEFPPADIVTLRAVERFGAILPIAARLVDSGGRLALLIGSSQLPALLTLVPEFCATAPIAIPQSQSRVLSILVR
jgi:16S rRNA (guanine527-N7)-methyltransferase